jgi:uncharacterized damage-inducible protein DinB
MNADAFRHLYDYHFAQNRSLWDNFVMSLSQEQFTQDFSYSIGSVRNQIVHLISVDNSWFSQILGEEEADWLNPAEFDDRNLLRAEWDRVEQKMRGYLATLRDDMLFTKPFPDHEEDYVLILWQVLLHVANHGTDHRAQILRLLHDLGQRTPPQDYVFYIYDHPMPTRT